MLNNLKRLVVIIQAFLKFFWSAFAVRKNRTARRQAVLLRQTLENLGSVFIKFGQFLSLRPDLIPNEYCRELFYLLEKVPPFPKNEVDKIFLEEFNATPEKIFKSFKSEPFAAASFGQVHEAYLKNGEKVAVKVQRPNIRNLVGQDIRLMRLLAKIVDLFPLGPNKLIPMIEEFKSWTLEELDYITEAKYTQEFYEHYKGNHLILVPKVYPDLSSSRILTAQFIDGITIANILLLKRAGEKVAISQLKKSGFSPRIVAETLLKSSIKQIYFDGFFHADPHPANIIFNPDKKLAYIDFGIVGRLDRKSRFACLRYVRSVLYGDTQNSFEAFMQLCDIDDPSAYPSLRKEHDQIVLETLDEFERSKNSEQRKEAVGQIMGKKLLKSIRLLQKYKIKIPQNTLRYFRALATLDSTIIELYPAIELGDIARKFRNISLANMIVELPSLMTPEKLNETLLKWLNVIEGEMVKEGGQVY